jgi:SRSO17 transposase
VSYVAGIQPKILVWSPRAAPKRRGKPLNNTGRRDEPDLISAKHLACDLPNHAWRTIRWREGSADWLSSRFARVRVRVGHSQLMPELLSQEWLLIEWPEGEAAPTKYWLSTLPANISFRELVDFANCAGLSSATIRSSSKRSDLATMKDADGAASIITAPCASQPTAS